METKIGKMKEKFDAIRTIREIRDKQLGQLYQSIMMLLK